MDKKLDLTKPVQTRDGQSARIVCTDMRGPEGKRYILALLSDDGGYEQSWLYHENGAVFSDGRLNSRDLVNVPEKKGTWVVIHDFDGSLMASAYKTKEEADTLQRVHRVACVYVEWEE